MLYKVCWGQTRQAAATEHRRLIKLREDYQTTCTMQSVCCDVASKESNKLSSQIDLAFSVEFNLAIQVQSNHHVKLAFSSCDSTLVILLC